MSFLLKVASKNPKFKSSLIKKLAQAKETIYLNYDPKYKQWYFRDAFNKRLDSFSGPRDHMIRVYLKSGYDVRDEKGQRLRLYNA